MSQARVTSATVEVLSKPEAKARASAIALEVVHSVEERAPPPPPPSGHRRAVVIVMG